MTRRIFALIFSLIIFSFTALASGGKVEVIGAFTDQSASDSVRNALEPKGYRVTLEDGTALCEIWLRNGAPARAKVDVPGAIYTELSESALVGVISFPKASKDFRGQGIKPGAYTLRYALHPTDGNHMGISPYRDFLLLVPVAADQDAEAAYKFQELVKMSANTTGTNHPSPLSLVSPEGQSAFPSVSHDANEHAIFAAKIKTRAGTELPIAFVVKGEAQQ